MSKPAAPQDLEWLPVLELAVTLVAHAVSSLMKPPNEERLVCLAGGRVYRPTTCPLCKAGKSHTQLVVE